LLGRLLSCLLVHTQLLGQLAKWDLGEQVVDVCGHGVVAFLRSSPAGSARRTY
jgi:hypothetical protein